MKKGIWLVLLLLVIFTACGENSDVHSEKHSDFQSPLEEANQTEADARESSDVTIASDTLHAQDDQKKSDQTSESSKSEQVTRPAIQLPEDVF